MTHPILSSLTDLRARYARHLERVEASDMDMLFKRVRMKELRAALEELDSQIAKEEAGGERLHCDISEAKRYADCHEQ